MTASPPRGHPPLPAASTGVDLQAVVHDLKNALGALESELERLAAQPGLAAVRPAHTHCSRLRQRLLGFLLVTSHEPALRAQVEAHSVDDFLQEVLAEVWLPKGAPDVRLRLEADCPATAFFDRRLVSLALHAALANARAFARARVRLGAAGAVAAGVVFYCEDDGPGWGAGATPGGSGLGGAICERVAHAHSHGAARGAFVRARSGLGGARVELHLP